MNRNLAYFFSGAFHPLIILTLLFGIAFIFYPFALSNIPDKARLYFIGVIFTTTFILPGLAVTMLKTSGLIGSIHMRKRADRFLPYGVVILIYGIVAYYLAWDKEINLVVSSIFYSTLVLLTVMLLITSFFKISMHSAGVCGLLGFVLGLQRFFPLDDNFLFLLSGLILAVGAVLTSRLSLNAHTMPEILAGGILGGLITYFCFYWFLMTI